MNRHTTSTLAAAVIAASPALAADLLHRKPGLWETRYSQLPGTIDAIMQTCVDAAVDKVDAGVTGGFAPEKCPKIYTQRSDGKITIEFTCTLEGKPAMGQTVIIGNLDSAYTMTQTVRREDVIGGILTRTIEGTRLGPCAADDRAGDIIIRLGPGSGARGNILDMLEAIKPPPQ
jgi:hypothetical protein